MNDDEESTFLGNRADQQLNNRPSVDDGESPIPDVEAGPSNSGLIARLNTFDDALFINLLRAQSTSGAGLRKMTVA